VNVLPVRTEIRAVLLKVLTVPADVGLVTCNVVLLVHPLTLLGVVVMQIAFIRAQIGAVALHILAVCPDIRPVMTNVPSVVGRIVTTLRAAIGRTTRLLVAATRVCAEGPGVYLHAGL
jgi:hypothetical protein